MASISATCLRLQAPLKVQFHKSGQVAGRIAPLNWVSVRPSSRTVRFQVSCAARPETVQKVCEIVRKQLALPPESELTPESKFSALGADSLDTVEIVMGLEEEFDISVEEENSQNITTVQEAADLIDKLVQKKDVA
ncbi:acyl carrier protein 1 chloroplastic [Tripterygium wilfordii]|uniref:Acyl carrier protein n=1 Tax=Tripterygium wilfordii TaxID=458696 RepID=A0A7J7C9Z4_TRIWF|nr:acyl carrier protein 4, chloroplastic-like [Tripterygium wilfordii]KAF5730991.1 acyl carrier protein 1 chloroplastic [Tripterygium wilfordii]